jgi:hypothetical protein
VRIRDEGFKEAAIMRFNEINNKSAAGVKQGELV